MRKMEDANHAVPIMQNGPSRRDWMFGLISVVVAWHVPAGRAATHQNGENRTGSIESPINSDEWVGVRFEGKGIK